MLFDLRVSIPDRPGTLGALAGALGKGGANILTLDVVEREEGYAVDDISVEAPAGMQDALRIAAEEVSGLVVENVRPADAFRDILAPMELAAKLSEEAPDTVIGTLVEGLPDAMWTSWAAAITVGHEGLKVLAISTGAPSLAEMKTPWLPLEGPRRLSKATWMPPRWKFGPATDIEFAGPEAAAAPLLDSSSALLVARRHGPRFRSAELRQLASLARIAGGSSRTATAETTGTSTGS